MTAAPRPLHLALYGEVDANIIDGSSVWLVSLAEMLARQGLRVTVLLRSPRRRDVLLGPLSAVAGVRLLDPGTETPLDAGGAVRALERLSETDPFDALILRGSRTAFRATFSRRLRPRLWAYLTDIPQPNEPPASLRRRLRVWRIGWAAHRLLCQTPELAAHLVRLAPRAAGRCVAAPPMVPDEAVGALPLPPPSGTPLRLVYVGKFAPLWNTLEMTALPSALAGRGVAAELHMIGDKFQKSEAVGFEERMRRALDTAAGVVWHRGHPRSAAMALAARGHVGMSWRAPGMDGSLELSTKLLEYGAVGLPVLCNPTPMHRRLFGDDYPLFAATADEVVSVLGRLAGDPTLHQAAAARSLEVARRFAFSRVGAELAAAVAEGCRP